MNVFSVILCVILSLLALRLIALQSEILQNLRFLAIQSILLSSKEAQYNAKTLHDLIEKSVKLYEEAKDIALGNNEMRMSLHDFEDEDLHR